MEEDDIVLGLELPLYFFMYNIQHIIKNNMTYKEMGQHDQKSRESFPGGAVVENPPADAADTGPSPGLGRSHMPRSN